MVSVRPLPGAVELIVRMTVHDGARRQVVSVDPGAVHCGVALWIQDDLTGLWTCAWAVERTPDECLDFIRAAVGAPRLTKVVVEGFWLKGGIDAVRQAGSQMETTEVIGVVRHLCRWHGTPFEKVANGQKAVITRLTAAGYRWVSRGHGDHAKDAEAVGVRGLGLRIRDLAQLAVGQ